MVCGSLIGVGSDSNEAAVRGGVAPHRIPLHQSGLDVENALLAVRMRTLRLFGHFSHLVDHGDLLLFTRC